MKSEKEKKRRNEDYSGDIPQKGRKTHLWGAGEPFWETLWISVFEKRPRKPFSYFTSSVPIPEAPILLPSHLSQDQERWEDIFSSDLAKSGSFLHASNFIPRFLRLPGNAWLRPIYLTRELTFYKSIWNHTFPHWRSTKVNIWILPTLIVEVIKFSSTFDTWAKPLRVEPAVISATSPTFLQMKKLSRTWLNPGYLSTYSANINMSLIFKTENSKHRYAQAVMSVVLLLLRSRVRTFTRQPPWEHM